MIKALIPTRADELIPGMRVDAKIGAGHVDEVESIRYIDVPGNREDRVVITFRGTAICNEREVRASTMFGVIPLD